MDLFPTNIAMGEAFCNRVKEWRLLLQYIKNNKHVVIIAPRRYGKTSLINQVLADSKYPYCLMELTLAVTPTDIEQIILRNVAELVQTILPRTKKAKQAVLNWFKWLNPQLILTVAGQKLIFTPEEKSQKSSDNIAEVLKKLDALAKQMKKRVVVVMDEFQQLNEINGHAIEASIRHAMQYSKNTSYIFSGSNRHMLQTMFNNKHRPFYNACEILQLDRISETEYEAFIQQAAKVKWRKKLSNEALQKIFLLSECHPSYLNRICGYFWLIGKLPTEKDVEDFWSEFIASKRSEFTEDILRLSSNQKKVLVFLASNPTKHISSRETCLALELPEASVRQAVKKLRQDDYIYEDENKEFSILDPAMRDFIKSIQ